MQNKKQIFFLLFLFVSSIFYGQNKGYDSGKKYEIASIEVAGETSFSKNTIIVYSGLTVGDSVFLPGEKISAAIKKLWESDLFSDVEVFLMNVTDDNRIHLQIKVNEVPQLNDTQVVDAKNKKEIKEVIEKSELTEGKRITENLLANTKGYLDKKYKKKGFANANSNISTVTTKDSLGKEKVDLIVNLNKGKKVKIKHLNFFGNNSITDYKLKSVMKNTKKLNYARVYKRSKFIKDDYKTDLSAIIDKYKENGYRDAIIKHDTIISNPDNTLSILINIDEGKKYYFGNIDFVGNSVYSDKILKNVLRINKGDTYNGILLQKRIADNTKPDGEDITNLYQNNGYLFSTITPVETKIENDTIDYEVRVIEGKLAYFNNISVVGNDKTNDHVIYRELRTRPGEKYSKDKVMRSVRELSQMGYFDPEQISPDFKNVDPNTGQLDIEYSVVEKGSSQVELQGGIGGGGFVGTLGLAFNNFSIKNIFNKEAYQPVPMGDGQTLSIRAQGSRLFQSYSFNFSEPWLGGKKPVRFSTSLSQTKQFLYNSFTGQVDKDRFFNISGVNLGLAKRLKVPDDYFQLSHSLGFQHYDLNNYNIGLFTFADGFSNNLSYTVGLTRNNSGPNPIFPMSGSNFSVSARFSPPYSLFNKKDYGSLGDLAEFQDDDGNAVNSLIDQEKYKWLEFYKVKFSGDWYNSIYKKLTLRTNAEFGFLGAYNKDRGIIPFERFYVGGTGMQGQRLDGRELVALRGYPDNGFTSANGGTIFNKFSMELRYPITMKQTASIYALTFLEGGNYYDGFDTYNPFEIKRSAGFGLRIFMPAIGLIGLDFGHGFDPLQPGLSKNGWETHFIIGQQF